MTTEQKARAYDEAVCKMKEIITMDNTPTIPREIGEYLFPELKESEDDKIRKECINIIDSWDKSCRLQGDYCEVASKCIAWLEKQGEQKPILDFKAKDWYASKVDGKIHNIYHSVDKVKPKFKVGDWVMLDRPVLITKVEDMPYNTYQYWTSDGTWFGDATKSKLWTIQDAKKGDVLVNQNGEMPFIFRECKDNHIYCYCGYTNRKDIFFDRFVNIEGEELHWVNLYYEQVYPATKEQRDLLFQKMKDDGYEWDAEKLELKEIEQNPINKIEPKFHEGEWVVQENIGVYKVIEVCESWYEVIDNKDKHYSIGFDKEYMCHLWTIKDAKDGDVLCCESGWTCIFKKLNHNSFGGLLFDSYCFIDRTGWFCDGAEGHTLDERINGRIYPATKEQRDLLFQKMKDDGYEWDAEKLELKEIEQNPINKIEPKFHEGEWVVWKDKCYKVNYNGCGYELVDQDGLSTSLEYDTIDENAHIWDVATDAKDGDVLATPNYIYIFNSIDKETETVSFYCLMKKSDEHFSFGDYKIFDEILNSTPATQEQRDLLFKKMKEEGYEWDAEKKLVDKIEPKFKVEAKFHEGEWITNGDYTWKILMVKFMCYVLQSQGGYVVEDTIPHVDEQFHSFTIQDAKAGDVLVSEHPLCGLGTWYCIFKSLDDDESMTVHCYLARDGRFETKKELCFDKDPYNTKPATKEQRETLMKAMADAGYTFDFNKKELKKIE